MKPLLNYPIVDGRIQTRSLEVHIVDHCNLKCAECCSLSPLLPENYVSPQQMHSDLSAACSVVSPTYLKLVGGEPLLHPQLLECLEVARPFAKILSVTTNALLIEKMEEGFWQLIDGLTISIYPKPRLKESTLEYIRAKGRAFNVELNIKEQSHFVQMTRWLERGKKAETQAIFDNCWLRERCHIVDKGRFYMCTRPPHFDTYDGGQSKFLEDGIALDSPSLLPQVHAYLKQKPPLETCFHCKGGWADEKPHRQMSKSDKISIAQVVL